jgi:hypothetical protein
VTERLRKLTGKFQDDERAPFQGGGKKCAETALGGLG